MAVELHYWVNPVVYFGMIFREKNRICGAIQNSSTGLDKYQKQIKIGNSSYYRFAESPQGCERG